MERRILLTTLIVIITICPSFILMGASDDVALFGAMCGASVGIWLALAERIRSHLRWRRLLKERDDTLIRLEENYLDRLRVIQSDTSPDFVSWERLSEVQNWYNEKRLAIYTEYAEQLNNA